MLAAALSSLSYNAPLVQGRSAVAVSRAAVAPTMNFLDDFKTPKPQKYDPMLGWIDDDSEAAAAKFVEKAPERPLFDTADGDWTGREQEELDFLNKELEEKGKYEHLARISELEGILGK